MFTETIAVQQPVRPLVLQMQASLSTNTPFHSGFCGTPEVPLGDFLKISFDHPSPDEACLCDPNVGLEPHHDSHLTRTIRFRGNVRNYNWMASKMTVHPTKQPVAPPPPDSHKDPVTEDMLKARKNHYRYAWKTPLALTPCRVKCETILFKLVEQGFCFLSQSCRTCNNLLLPEPSNSLSCLQTVVVWRRFPGVVILVSTNMVRMELNFKYCWRFEPCTWMMRVSAKGKQQLNMFVWTVYFQYLRLKVPVTAVT